MEENWKKTFYKDILRFGTLFACFLLMMGRVTQRLPLLWENHALLRFFLPLAWLTFLECLAASGIFYYHWNRKPEQENHENREHK